MAEKIAIYETVFNDRARKNTYVFRAARRLSEAETRLLVRTLLSGKKKIEADRRYIIDTLIGVDGRLSLAGW